MFRWMPILALLLAVLAADAPAATKRKVVGPVDRKFHLRKELHVGHSDAGGQCTPGSMAIRAAYRCTSDNLVLDPCWPGRNDAGFIRFYCWLNPWAKAVFQVSPDTFQVLPRDARADRRTPWGIRLATGQRCVKIQGAGDAFEGRALRWTCSQRLFLRDDLSKARPTWRVTLVRRTANGYSRVGRRAVAVAFFGRKAREP